MNLVESSIGLLKVLKMKTKGQKLEIYVAGRLQGILNDSHIRPTKASSGGAHNTEIGDIQCSKFFIECKAHKDKFFSRAVWKKLIDSLPFGTAKVPLYITDDENARYVMMDLEDFFRLLEGK